MTSGSAVRLASVARHVTECATWPGKEDCNEKKLLFGATNQSFQIVLLTENGFYDDFAQSCLVLYCCPILGC